MKTISIGTISELKKLLAKRGVTLHFTDSCGSQSAEIIYPNVLAYDDICAAKSEIEDFLAREGFQVIFSKTGDSFWVQQDK